MIIRILNSPRSARTSLEYNNNKLALGLGATIALHNIDGEGEYDIEKAITAQEKNPNIHGRTRTLGFHAAISPGPGEEMTDETAARFAQEYMNYLGFGGQPWVLYKHTDIDRVHYHVVSSKVKRDGKVIHNSFSAYRTKDFIKTIGPSFGLYLGRNPNAPKETTKYVRRFNAAKGDIVRQMNHFFKESLKFNYGSVEEFLDVMKSFGIHTDIREDRSLGFIGLDRDGRRTGNYIGSVDKEMFNKIVSNIKQREEEKTYDCSALVESCMEVADSEKAFVSELRKAGIDAFFEKDASDNYTAARFVDHATNAVFDFDDFGNTLSLEMLNLTAREWNHASLSSSAYPSWDHREYQNFRTSELDDFFDNMIGKLEKRIGKRA